jgi:hypothetical protein
MSAEFPPREACPVKVCAGFGTCACGWSNHPMMDDTPCQAALEEAQDRAVRRLLESGIDWRAPEQFLNENRKERADGAKG